MLRGRESHQLRTLGGAPSPCGAAARPHPTVPALAARPTGEALSGSRDAPGEGSRDDVGRDAVEGAHVGLCS